jgi:hypothetical protein
MRCDVRDSPSRDVRSSPVREAPVFTCAGCGQRWLVAGLEDGENYTCKTCDHSFQARRDGAGSRSSGFGSGADSPD